MHVVEYAITNLFFIRDIRSADDTLKCWWSPDHEEQSLRAFADDVLIDRFSTSPGHRVCPIPFLFHFTLVFSAWKIKIKCYGTTLKSLRNRSHNKSLLTKTDHLPECDFRTLYKDCFHVFNFLNVAAVITLNEVTVRYAHYATGIFLLSSVLYTQAYLIAYDNFE